MWPVCLHKDHDHWWDITRMCDQVLVLLGDCGGIRIEKRI
jgi:hypothetical protein